ARARRLLPDKGRGGRCSVQRGWRVSFVNLDDASGYAGMSPCEPRQRGPDVTTEDGEERGHRNRPGSRAGERGHFGLGLFEHQPKLRCITSQPAPGSRELYRALSAPPGAVNEGNAG